MSEPRKCAITSCTRDAVKRSYCVDHYNAEYFPQNKPLAMTDDTKNDDDYKKIAASGERSVHKKTINTLVQSLEKTPKFGAMCEYSIGCLVNVVQDEDSIVALIECGGIDTLMKLIKLHPDNETLHQLVHSILQTGFEHCPEAMAEAMKAYADYSGFVHSLLNHHDPGSVASTAKTAKLVGNQALCMEDWIDDGAIDGLTGAINRFPEEMVVIRCCADALSVLSYQQQDVARIIDSMAAQNLIMAVGRNPQIALLAGNVADVLANVAGICHSQQLHYLRSLGVIDILIEALDMHPNNKPMVASIKRAILLLSGESDMQTAVRRVQEVGLQIHSGNFESSFRRLAGLMLVDEHVETLFKSLGPDAPDVFTSVLKHCAKELKTQQADGEMAKIVRNAIFGMRRCVFDGDEHKVYQLMQSGGLKTAIKLLQTHKAHEEIASEIIRLMSSCCTRDANIEYMIKRGGLQGCMDALAAQPNSTVIKQAALDFFADIAKFANLVPELFKAGSVAKTIELLGDADLETVMKALRVLGLIASHGGDCIRKLIEAGVIKGLLNLLRYYSSDEFFQAMFNMSADKKVQVLRMLKQLFRLITCIATVPEGAQLLREGGAVDMVCRIMNYFADDAELQRLGHELLQSLAERMEVEAAVRKEKKKFEFAKVRKLEDDENAAKQSNADMEEQLRQWLLRLAEIEELKKNGEARRARERELKLQAAQEAAAHKEELQRRKEWLAAETAMVNEHLHQMEVEKAKEGNLKHVNAKDKADRAWERRRIEMRNVGKVRSKGKYKQSALLKGKKSARALFADDED